MKIKFISNNPHYFESPEATHPTSSDNSGTNCMLGSGSGTYRSRDGEWCVINSAYFALRHWYRLYGRHWDRVVWQMPEIVSTRSAREQLESLIQDPPDVLALAVFIWNEPTQHWLAREFKQRFPHSTVIMGGPQLTAHRNPEFFKEFPWVDWAVYGDGERPFQQIVDLLCDPNSIPESDIRNAVRLCQGQWTCYPHELLADSEYLAQSVWLGQEDEVRRVVAGLNSAGIPSSHVKFAVEFARGCMYECTFCDWGQTLSNKVKRRRSDWRKEIDLFHRVDVPIRESDANFGQWPEDIEIFEYANSLTQSNSNFYFIPKNLSKLKRSSILYIMRRCYEVHGNQGHAYQDWALQDPDERVLEAVDRPSIPFDDVCRMIQELNKSVNSDLSLNHTVQLIIGLAGQSLDSWSRSIQRIWNEAGIKRFNVETWNYLPNSPAASADYVQQYQISTTPAYIPNKICDPGVQSLDELYQRCATNIDINHLFSSTTLITHTSTMNHTESLAAIFLLNLLTRLSILKKTKHFKITNAELDRLRHMSLQNAVQLYAVIEPYIKKYGFVIMGKRVNGKIGNSKLPLMPW